MQTPLVTIGIPVYNEEKYIEETIESVINQNYDNVEIIISDNCSSDKSFELINAKIKGNPKFRVISHKQNIGPFDNFKVLLDQAKGKYFMWLGGHDVMIKDYIEDAVNQLEGDSSIAAIYPKVYEIKEGVLIEDKLLNPDYEIDPDNIPDRIIKIIETTIRGSAFHSVFRKEVLRKSFIKLDGGDLTLFLTACSLGKLLPSANVGLSMRTVRCSETAEEQKKRYKSYGFSEGWEMVKFMYPFQLVVNLKNISVKDKITLLKRVKVALRKIYGNHSWITISKYHLKRMKIKTFIFCSYCYISDKFK